MATDLERDVIAAINGVPRLRANTRRAVAITVERVLEAARDRAHNAGVPQAYFKYLQENTKPPSTAERRARARAYSQARDQLGDEAVAIVIEHETTLRYQSFLDD
jgi:hypothetical protein